MIDTLIMLIVLIIVIGIRRILTIVAALVCGLGGNELMPRVMMQPPGYPPAEEYSECDEPDGLDWIAWAACVEKNNW